MPLCSQNHVFQNQITKFLLNHTILLLQLKLFFKKIETQFAIL
jgi:hypothetical protein